GPGSGWRSRARSSRRTAGGSGSRGPAAGRAGGSRCRGRGRTRGVMQRCLRLGARETFSLQAVAQPLWVLRPRGAGPHGGRPDFDRQLTEKGERQARAAGVALAAQGVDFAAVYTSPRVRARETARLACESLGREPEVVEALSGGFEHDDAVGLLAGA